MATQKEINWIMEELIEEANYLFSSKGLKIRIDDNVTVLPEGKMIKTGCNGIYYGFRNEIQIRRAMIGDIVYTYRCNQHLPLRQFWIFRKALQTLIHERGHQVHFKVMGQEKVDVDYISSYGKKNNNEAFAVAFQEYVMDENKNNDKLISVLERYNLYGNIEEENINNKKASQEYEQELDA